MPLFLSLSTLFTWQIAWLGAITTNSWREIILAKASLGHGREQQMKLFSYLKQANLWPCFLIFCWPNQKLIALPTAKYAVVYCQ